MLSLAKDLLKKTQSKEAQEIKPLTVCFWSDFMANPSVMYGLFLPQPHRLNYDPDKVKVMGTKDGMINQINISTVEDLDAFCEQIIGIPFLLRIWIQFSHNQYIGEPQPDIHFENDLALLVDTSHPMVRPELEHALDQARKILQEGGRFCVQLDFSNAIDFWLKTTYRKKYATNLLRVHQHRARLYITNYDKPRRCFDCNAVWCMVLGPCWLLSTPCYKIYRRIKCRDLVINLTAPIVRRTTLAISGKSIEVTR